MTYFSVPLTFQPGDPSVATMEENGNGMAHASQCGDQDVLQIVSTPRILEGVLLDLKERKTKVNFDSALALNQTFKRASKDYTTVV
jgi:hypothetical protein